MKRTPGAGHGTSRAGAGIFRRRRTLALRCGGNFDKRGVGTVTNNRCFSCRCRGLRTHISNTPASSVPALGTNAGHACAASIGAKCHVLSNFTHIGCSCGCHCVISLMTHCSNVSGLSSGH